jgi:hypothetical protein
MIVNAIDPAVFCFIGKFYPLLQKYPGYQSWELCDKCKHGSVKPFSNKISNHEWTKIVFSPFIKEKFKCSYVYNCRRVLSFDSLDHFESNEQNLPMNQNTAGFSTWTNFFTAILTNDV